MTAWIDLLNRGILREYNVVLTGGHAEPFYRAARNGRPAEIRYTRNYPRSALHELAHWCLAGDERRRRDDYGYWYAPDGRDAAQQQSFYRVEVRPQAIEKHFCRTLDLPFEVSADNLDNPDPDGLDAFRTAVDAQYRSYAQAGLPARAAAINAQLLGWRETVI